MNNVKFTNHPDLVPENQRKQCSNMNLKSPSSCWLPILTVLFGFLKDA
jgi:hypothetical protein